MRTILIFALVVIVAAPSTLALPGKTSEELQYHAWREDAAARLNDYDFLYQFKLAILTRRVDATHVQVKMAYAGRVPNCRRILQPLRALPADEDDVQRQKVGRESAWGTGKVINEDGPGNLLDFDDVIEAPSDASFLLVTVIPNGNSNQPPETIVLTVVAPIVSSWSFVSGDFDAPRE